MSKTESKRKDDRTRTWTAVVYPESLPEGWRDMLDALAIPWAESPLHDQDVDGDGKPKKPHYHLLFAFEGKKSYEQVKEITDMLHAPIPQRVASAKGCIRYMAHLDNPDKHQYSPGQIVGHGGLDVAHYLKASAASRYQAIKEMMEYVADHDIIEMEDLLLYAANQRFDDWFPLLCDNSAYILSQFIKSRRHRAERSRSESPRKLRIVRVDRSTGEVMEE